jgi:hypothetical protein
MFLWTPILAEPPLCSLDDLRTRYSLMDLCGFHEALELKSEMHRAAMREAERRAKAQAP